jgi:hypothetical protein
VYFNSDGSFGADIVYLSTGVVNWDYVTYAAPVVVCVK